LKKEGRELPKAENWPGCDNTVIKPELSGGRIPLQDKYCHESESAVIRCVSTGLNYTFIILITMAHHDRSICECVIILAEKGGLSASTAGELYGVPMSTARE
jgi:hypothetical protein